MTTLRDRFDKTHEKGGFTYIGWSQAADRLDDAAPGWSFSVVQIGPDWVLGRLTLKDGQWFENIGYAENADATWKKEPLKDAVSDSLKRCAALAGVARYLYEGDEPEPRTSRPAGNSSPAANGGAAGRSPRPVASTVPPEPEELADAFGLQHNGPTVVDEGTCPRHNKPWRENSRGFYCSSKEDDGSWCAEKPTQRWISARGAVAASR